MSFRSYPLLKLGKSLVQQVSPTRYCHAEQHHQHNEPTPLLRTPRAGLRHQVGQRGHTES
jgi:hypothetical protein